MRNARVLVLLVVASLGLGCAGSTPTLMSSSDVAALQGSWNLVSIQPAGELEQPKPAGASYSITFGDGRLSMRVDCNSCSGAYAIDGQTLTAGPSLACTRAACGTMAFENACTRLLGGDSTISVTNGALVLTSTRGVLRFVR